MTAARPSAIGAPGYSETMPREEASVPRARRLVSAALHAWGLSSKVDAGALITSELVTNSVLHSGGHSLRVSIRLHERARVRIAVADNSRAAPSPRRASHDEEAGRGLLLVDTMAHQWGTDRRHWGKIVWAELLAESSA
ncbi:ATP-binding protein [Streptomyces syringium]|uniref:ATP-binding protein n=1 Tax=Streptomyces syringium TaxID=76729 RepID=UPI00340FDE3F